MFNGYIITLLFNCMSDAADNPRHFVLFPTLITSGEIRYMDGHAQARQPENSIVISLFRLFLHLEESLVWHVD